MKLGTQTLNIKALMRRGWLDSEMRVQLNNAKVVQYALEMKHGAEFPDPIVFIEAKTERFFVGDGFHRIASKSQNGEKDVRVEIRRGGFREAFLHNIEANKCQRGLPFSTGDKQRCILTLMRDEETRQWTQSRIAETVGSSQAYVSWTVKRFADELGPRPEEVIDRNGRKMKRKHYTGPANAREKKEEVLNLHLEGKSNNEIHKLTGASRATVTRYLQEAESEFEDCPHCHGTGKVRR